MSFHPLFAEPIQIGQTLLAMGVKSATFVDECNGDIYIYHNISKHEFQFGRQGDVMTNYDLSPADTGVVCQWCGRTEDQEPCGHCVDICPVNTLELVYIGDEFYMESGTFMSSLYTADDYKRSDWGKVSVALRHGSHVHIRLATQQEIGMFHKKLAKLKEDRNVPATP